MTEYILMGISILGINLFLLSVIDCYFAVMSLKDTIRSLKYTVRSLNYTINDFREELNHGK